uniref:Uncharacterized protein n=1 Tax=Leviviridae sp. TaxID=2027243 RepID=A0A142D857_9VIRU|nr:hypothetical protein [Leviviridae sp.]
MEPMVLRLSRKTRPLTQTIYWNVYVRGFCIIGILGACAFGSMLGCTSNGAGRRPRASRAQEERGIVPLGRTTVTVLRAKSGHRPPPTIHLHFIKEVETSSQRNWRPKRRGRQGFYPEERHCVALLGYSLVHASKDARAAG